MKFKFQKKLALVVLLIAVAVIPQSTEKTWAQAAGSGSTLWTIETVRSSTGLTSLALTTLANIPIVAYPIRGNSLRLSSRSGAGSAWVHDDSLSSTPFDSLTDLSATPMGTSGIAVGFKFVDSSELGVLPKLGSFMTTGWRLPWSERQLIDGNTKFENTGHYEVMATNPDNNRPCVAYRHVREDVRVGTDDNRLFLSCYDSTTITGNWTDPAPTAITTGGISSYVGFAVEPGGRQHFALTDLNAGGVSLWHARREASGTMTTASIPIGGAVSDDFYKDLVLDGSGAAHIFYYDPGSGDLKYSWRQAVSDAVLQSITIDSTGNVGQHVSAAICNNTYHLAYYDVTNKALKYARCLSGCTNAPNWLVSLVDPATPNPARIDRGKFAQIACGSDNIVHIAYYDANAPELKYATPRICGNGIREGVEVCDDGNLVTESCAYGQPSCTVCDATCQSVAGATSFCSDGRCDDVNETNATCPADCPASCGNNICDNGETNATCPGDCPAVCGNGIQEAGEVCDDGGVMDCDAGNCRGDCSAPETGCGDGFLCGTEECDDSDLDNGDGCSATCRIEVAGPRCGDGLCNGTDTCSNCAADCGPCPVCGNGIQEAGEVCDDGNRTDCDAGGCRGDCSALETGCGDGFLCAPEQCEDRNMASDDGCSAMCENEVTPRCGDNILQVGEECDDNNNFSGDGCSATCRREARPECGDGTCNGTEACGTCPADCGRCPGPVCGNNVKEEGEGCDDGNLNSGDGCSPSCQTEPQLPMPIPMAPLPGPDVGTTTGSANSSELPVGRGFLRAKGGCALLKEEL